MKQKRKKKTMLAKMLCALGGAIMIAGVTLMISWLAQLERGKKLLNVRNQQKRVGSLKKLPVDILKALLSYCETSKRKQRAKELAEIVALVEKHTARRQRMYGRMTIEQLERAQETYRCYEMAGRFEELLPILVKKKEEQLTKL